MSFIDRDHIRREGTRILPPLVPAAFLLLGWLVDGRVASVGLDATVLGIVLGTVVMAGGGAIMAWGLATQLRAGTDPNPLAATTALTTSGPYAWSRNPIYVAELMLQAGFALLFAWEWALLTLPITWAFLRFYVIRNEERFLTEMFHDAYADYRLRVRRWF